MAAQVPYPSAEELRAIFSYDPCTGELRWRQRADKDLAWNRRHAGQIAGTTMKHGYRLIHTDGRGMLAHRIAWIMHYGACPLDKFIDHKNGDRSDNSILNLRLSTMQENLRNRKAKKFRHNLPMGVTRTKQNKPFKASIRIEKGRKTFLGCFETAEAAGAAYREAALKYHGEFAFLARA